MVRRFRVIRAVRAALLSGTGFIVCVSALLYAYVLAAPEGNRLRGLAERTGLLPGVSEALRAAESSVKAAHVAYERGDIIDLERAAELMSRARILRRSDGRIAADQALVLCAEVDSLLRWERDLQRQLEDVTDAKGARARELRETAAEKRIRATALLDQAAAAVTDATELAPSARETLRASADYHRLINDFGKANDDLSRAKASGADDPWISAIEASILAGDLEKASANKLADAERILSRTLAIAPDFVSARVQMARVLLAQGAIERAEHELRFAISRVPAHEEAHRLLARVNELKPQASVGGQARR
jgi:predicted Zn-dependent protease